MESKMVSYIYSNFYSWKLWKGH